MHVRVDSGSMRATSVPPYYDSMIAKLIVYGRTREGCIMRLKRALEEMVIGGIKTNIPLHQALLRDPDVINGDYTIKWLEEWLALCPAMDETSCGTSHISIFHEIWNRNRPSLRFLPLPMIRGSICSVCW
jgi:acetyl/propionyl-CoA carboxylase alpha subunit